MLSEKPWKLDGILRLMAVIFGCLCFVSLLQMTAQRLAGKEAFEEGSLLYLLFSSLALHGSILAGTAFFLWFQDITWSEAFGFRTPPIATVILLGIGAALVFLPVGIVLQDISIKVLNWWHVEITPQAAVEEFSKTVSWASRAYLAAFAIILAPIAEEIFFRGLLYPTLKQLSFARPLPEEQDGLFVMADLGEGNESLENTGEPRPGRFGRTREPGSHPKLALWVSAIAFAAIHHSAAIFLPLLILGLVLAWLYEKTNNLLASITAHSVFNAINVALLFVGDRLQEIFDRHFHHF